MTSRSGDAPRSTRHPRDEDDQLRQDLITAANRLLENSGTHESLSLHAVARDAGVAETSAYLHFPDKMALVLAVYQRHFADLARRVDQAVAEFTGPAARLRAAVVAYCQFAAEHPEAYYVMFSMPGLVNPADPIPDGQRPGAALIGSVQNVIIECIDAGLMHPADPYQATLCLWAALHGLISLRVGRPQVPWPPFDALVDTLITSLLCPEGRMRQAPPDTMA